MSVPSAKLCLDDGTASDDFECSFVGQMLVNLSSFGSREIGANVEDGTIVGIDQHIEDLKAMFVYAPDTRIHEHPVKVASGEWTSVIGVMEGTFTQPMPTRAMAPAASTSVRMMQSALLLIQLAIGPHGLLAPDAYTPPCGQGLTVTF